jgi:lipopolysaccharide export LptBFGC system permease protein LptF
MRWTLVDNYLWREMLDSFLLAAVVFSFIAFFSSTLLQFIQDAYSLGLPGPQLLQMIGLQLPKTVALVLPPSCFLAALWVFNHLSHTQQLTALRSTGVSLTRLLRVPLILGVLAAGLGYFLTDYVVPACNQETEQLKREAIAAGNLPARGRGVLMQTALQEDGTPSMFVYLGRVEGKQLWDASILDLSNPGLLQVVQARRGQWQPAQWAFEEANAYTVSHKTSLMVFNHLQRFNIQQPLAGKLTAPGEDDDTTGSSSSALRSGELPFATLYQRIQARVAAGQRVAKSTYLNMWEKITLPLSSLFIVLTAVPLGLTPPRAASNRGFVFALAVLFGYYLVRSLCIALGQSGVLESAGVLGRPEAMALAAWLPLLLLALLGLGLVYQKDARVG